MSARERKRMTAGCVEQMTAIHRFRIMENQTEMFLGGPYAQVTVITGSTVKAVINIKRTWS